MLQRLSDRILKTPTPIASTNIGSGKHTSAPSFCDGLISLYYGQEFRLEGPDLGSQRKPLLQCGQSRSTAHRILRAPHQQGIVLIPVLSM